MRSAGLSAAGGEDLGLDLGRRPARGPRSRACSRRPPGRRSRAGPRRARSLSRSGSLLDVEPHAVQVGGLAVADGDDEALADEDQDLAELDDLLRVHVAGRSSGRRRACRRRPRAWAAGARGWRPRPPARAGRTRAGPSRTPPRWARAGRSRRTRPALSRPRRRAPAPAGRRAGGPPRRRRSRRSSLAKPTGQLQRLLARAPPRRRRPPPRAAPAACRSPRPARCPARPPARRRAGAAAAGPRSRQSSASAISSRASSRWAAIAGSALLPPGGQAVGAGEHGDLHLHGAGVLEVAVDVAARERRAVHQEAEHQVVPGQAAHERAQPLAGAQPAADGARPSRRPPRRGR